MNNREMENYFSPFSRKGFNCVGFLYKRPSYLEMLSVSTETTRETTNAMRRQEKSCFV